MAAPSEPVATPLMATVQRAPSEPVMIPPVMMTAPAVSALSMSADPPMVTTMTAGSTLGEPVSAVLPRVGSVALPGATTAYRYTVSPQPVSTFGAIAAPAYVSSPGPFGTGQFGAPATYQPDVFIPMQPPQPPIGFQGGYDFKFYGPDEYKPPMFDDRNHFGETSAIDFPELDFGFGRHDHGGYGPGRDEPVAPQPPQLQEADKYDAMAAEHERQVELLAQQPVNNQNLERQIQELLEGQRALRTELEDVKATVSMNYRDLEVLRREAEHQAAMAQPAHHSQPPYGYYDQGPPPQDMGYGQDPGFTSGQMQPIGPDPTAQVSGMDASTAERSFAGSSRMPPRNLGYEDTAANVLESLSRVKDQVTAHATALHGHATRSLKSIGVGDAGGTQSGGTQSGATQTGGSSKRKLCGKACP